MISIVIPTKNRIDSLKTLIHSIFQQTILPNEVIIMDQSEKNNGEIIKNWFKEKKIKLKYIYNPEITGLTQAKNIGVKSSNGELIFFFDDDLELFPDFLEKMDLKMKEYPNLYGICGQQYLKKQKSRLYLFIRNLTRRGPFNINVKDQHKYNDIILARKISGGITVYRREIFEKYEFDENLIKYSLGEDYDFSYRVSKEYEIGRYKEAIAYHYHDTSGRLNLKNIFEARICFFNYFYNKNIKKTNERFKKISYIWLNIGIIMDALLMCILKLNLDPLKGILSARKKIKNNYKNTDCILIKKDKIKILQVFGSLNRGGAETMLMNIYRNIDRKKYEFYFLCSTEKENCDYEDEVKKMGGKIYKILPPNKIGYIKHYKELVKIMKETEKYDIIHIHTLLHAGIVSSAAKKAHIKNIMVHSHSTKSGNSNSILARFYEVISKFLIRKNANYYLACSQKAGEYLFGKKNIKKIMIINNGILLDDFLNVNFENSKITEQLELKDNEIIIGNVARFTKEKNHEFFIKLAKKLIEEQVKFKILLIGEGPMQEKIKNIIERENLKKYFILLGKRNDIPQLMNIMNIFLLPSLYEGIPLTIIEAQASGLICLVSTNVDNNVDLGLNLVKFLDIENIDKWIDEIKNKKINKLEDKDEIRQKIEQQGYNSKLNVKKIEELYNV